MSSFPKLQEDTMFKKNWEAYQLVIRKDYLQHSTLHAKVPEYLQSRFSKPFSILDLGCGDVDYLTKILQKHNIWPRVSSYTGVDLSEQAVQIGEKNVRMMLTNEAQVSFVVDNMLNFARKAATMSYDFVFACFAVHHLQDNEKEQLVREIGRILKPNGTFMIIDSFLQEDEDRDNFMKDFITYIRNGWVALNSEAIESFVNHIFNFDFPTKLTAYRHWAQQCSVYNEVKCLESLRFYKTVVFEVEKGS